MQGGADSQAATVSTDRLSFALLVGAALFTPLAMAVWFAPPLVALGGVPAFAAMQASQYPGWLGIEYALKYGANLRSMVLSNTCGDMPHLITELIRLRGSLGPETVAMMLRHEAQGTFNHPAYQAAITLLNYRHVCRLDEYPASLKRSLEDWNMDVYCTMQGPNEFCYTGNLKDWNRIPDMRGIKVPCLIINGEHDELPPSCGMRMHQVLPNSNIVIFPKSSHTPLYEEPEWYQRVLLDFLRKH